MFQELLDNSVQMFVAVLAPHSPLAGAELERRCVGLVGAGEAIAGDLVRGRSGKAEAIDSFAVLVAGALR